IMIWPVFITVISGHDKSQPPGCLLDISSLFYFYNQKHGMLKSGCLWLLSTAELLTVWSTWHPVGIFA
ncbi:hypothetical protein ACN6OE_21855, partial [Escherichia coli]